MPTAPFSQKSHFVAIFGSPVKGRDAFCKSLRCAQTLCIGVGSSSFPKISGVALRFSGALVNPYGIFRIGSPCGQTYCFDADGSFFPKISLRCDFREPCKGARRVLQESALRANSLHWRRFLLFPKNLGRCPAIFGSPSKSVRHIPHRFALRANLLL